MEQNSRQKAATEKLQSEMDQYKNDAYVQTVGQFLVHQVENYINAADSILTTNKTIKNSLEVMKNEAKKKAVNGFAMLTPDEGFALVLKYFGIKLEKIEVPGAKTPVKNSSRFDVKLDDFL